jgi:hypothetical protein
VGLALGVDVFVNPLGVQFSGGAIVGEAISSSLMLFASQARCAAANGPLVPS